MAGAATDRKADNKEKALDTALTQIERSFGKGAIMRMGEEGGPTAIEAIATNTRICCHCETMPGNAVSVTRVNTASAATFGAEAKKAVTGVGAPS